MSQPGENASGKVIRLEARRVERRVSGIGTAVFRAPSLGDEVRLAQFYDAEAPDHRAFVNETVAATLEAPVVGPTTSTRGRSGRGRWLVSLSPRLPAARATTAAWRDRA